MSVQNEKLIEEAEQRYPDIEANPETFPTGWSREQERNAFIAGAVFETALTPTDDELRDAIDHIEGAVEFQDAINSEAVRVVIEAACRSEVPEPSEREAKVHGELVTMRVKEWRRITDELARLRTIEGQLEEHPEPKGEPSDAQVLAAKRAINLRFYRTDTREFDAYAWGRLYREMAVDALRAAGVGGAQ